MQPTSGMLILLAAAAAAATTTLPVRFVFSRSEFRRVAADRRLIVSDFSTSPAHLLQSQPPQRQAPPSTGGEDDTVLSLGLMFSHVRAGLPFDFGLQPGLVRVHATTAGRRLDRRTAEHEWKVTVRPRGGRRHRTHRRHASGPVGLDDHSATLRGRSEVVRNQVQDGARPVALNGTGRSGLHAAAGLHGKRPSVRDDRSRAGRFPLRDTIRFAQPKGSYGPHGPHRHRGGKDAASAPPRGGGGSWAGDVATPEDVARGQGDADGAAGKVGTGNGGDDFTFSFPAHEGFYRVFAFGFDLFDDQVAVGHVTATPCVRARPPVSMSMSMSMPMSTSMSMSMSMSHVPCPCPCPCKGDQSRPRREYNAGGDGRRR